MAAEPLLTLRTWGFITIGVAIAAVPVVGYLCIKSGVGNILRVFPQLFTDSEYDFGKEHILNMLWKFLILCDTFGYANTVLWIMLLIGCGMLKRMRRKEAETSGMPQGKGAARKKAPGGTSRRAYFTDARCRRILFLAACACLVSSYLCAVIHFARYKSDTQSHQFYMYYFYHSYPAAMFTAVCGMLLRQKTPGSASFWWTAIIADLFNTYGSQVSSSVCGVLLFPWMFYAAVCLCRELQTEQADGAGKARGVRRLTRSVLTVGLCACIFFEGIGLYVMRFYLPIEHYESGETGEPVDRMLLRGPQKGLITNRKIFDVYESYLSDLERLNAMGEGRVYIMGTYPSSYLFMDRPVGTYSTWFVEDDALERQLRYLQLLPENRPALIYIPWIDYVTYRVPDSLDEEDETPGYKQKLAWVGAFADCTVSEGNVGYIVQVNEWRLPPAERE